MTGSSVGSSGAAALPRPLSSSGGLDRRQLLAGAAALAAGAGTGIGAAGADTRPIYIADMHCHLFFVGPRPAGKQPLGANMAAGKATLVSWSLVADQPWLRIAPGGFAPNGKPGKGQASAWLREEAARAKAHLAEQRLTLALTPQDVADAVAGKPHVLLSVEGATFADDDVEPLKVAHELGVRHVQLVHFLTNRIGDVQTEPARLGGLTEHGRRVVEFCNRNGLLIDLAHCTERVVDQVLEVSKAPVVWSHSSVAGWRALLPFGLPAFARRQLPLPAAKRIAARGGVVGLWALGADVGTTPESYAARILDLAHQLGENHVGFGTDMNALSRPALSGYADLRRVVDTMLKRGEKEAVVRKIAIDNYARVLTAAMTATA